VTLRLAAAGAVLWSLTGQAAIRAELRQVDLKARGMDCATCAHAVTVRLMQIEGVESVHVSLDSGIAAIRLRPGNSVALESLIEVPRRNGFHPISAGVTARGVASLVDGAVTVTLLTSDTRLMLEADSGRREIFEALVAAVTASPEVAIEVTGDVSFKDRRIGPLKLTAFTRLTASP
jgi:copper chaperone CopZ